MNNPTIDSIYGPTPSFIRWGFLFYTIFMIKSIYEKIYNNRTRKTTHKGVV